MGRSIGSTVECSALSPRSPNYCLDSSTIINLRQDFPEDIFEGLWSGLQGLASEGRLVIHTLVRAELDVKDDDCGAWVRTLNPDPFLEIDQDQGEFIKRMAGDYPYLAHKLEKTEYAHQADPFVLATCVTRGLVLVTDEGPQQWKLPDLCRIYGVECLDRFGLMRKEKWRFSPFSSG